MNHEHEQSRASSPAAAASHHHDTIEPGQSSRSALLRKPDHAVASGLVQRKARDANGVADSAESAVSAALSSSGLPLPDTLMRKFESSLGADLSGVRVHTGAASERAADAVSAKAYTMGNDIHFGTGHYDPSSSGGQHLLAHEVAHTVQQSGGVKRVQFKLDVSSPGDSLEHEADCAADAMVAGAAATISSVTGLSRYALQRQPAKSDAGTDAGDTGPQKKSNIGPNPPAPDPRWEVAEYKDNTGTLHRVFHLKKPEDYFVAYGASAMHMSGKPEQCYYPAKETLDKLTKESLIEGPHLMTPARPAKSSSVWPPRLTVYSDHKAIGDKLSLTFDPGRTAQILAYLKKSLDQGQPLIVGVNENWNIARDPADGRTINNGITSHYAVLTGYEALFSNGEWSITSLSGIDNSTADKKRPESFPQFTVQPDGSITKPRTGLAGYAYNAKYIITEIRVYRADFEDMKDTEAWFGPKDKLVPTPPQEPAAPASPMAP